MLVARKDIARDVQIKLRRHDLIVSVSLADAIVAEVLDTIAMHLGTGSEVRFRDFGAFKVQETPSRMGRNPKTGEEIPIEAHNRVVFKAGKALKQRVNEDK